ncbi:PA0069 family radical SAM protein [Denitromonas iodatirespirans]|uniref:PA0069 family radical SAM protein n=1 Tax=Denitromonas iodatirespirans TaxID=2795389 RepID=A0A944H8N6_DENI1|nr:PA0069 family radical SAM protein [Denitromonas iodatirespirans]MBT0962513.1 PA0069 family radical SAM protein [Denitromonas iodatirespirans]
MNTPPLKGRGTGERPDSRFADWQREACDDGWPVQDDTPAPATELMIDTARSVISYNQSPDVPFDRSINPYRGCEHGCVYCFARPSHAWLGLSPGLDFETRLAWKPDAAARLREELAARSYRCAPIALGVNTDAYQPVERQLGITREILKVLDATAHPVVIITKSALIERDIDILSTMSRRRLVQVMVSVTTLEPDLARTLEPRAPAPHRRLRTIAALAEAGVPVGVLFAPLIPALNDAEMETVLAEAAGRGASTAGYGLLRLPREVGPLFEGWLRDHAPERAEHVMSLLRQLRGGRVNDPRFGQRMRGTGLFADLYRQRFALACRQLGLAPRHLALDTEGFLPPGDTRQGCLF